MKKILVIISAISGGILFLLCFYIILFEYRAVDIPLEKCTIREGIVTGIKVGGVNDVVFNLQSADTSYYINRGFENGLTLGDLKKEIVGKKVQIYFSDHFSFLRTGTPSWHIRKMMVGTKIFYSEY